MQIRTVEAANGWRWLVQGMLIFRTDPPRWLLLIGILFIGSRLLLVIPYLGLLVMLVTPNFLAGLAHGAQAVAQGKPLRPGYLASGFLKNATYLITLGAVSLAGQFLMVAAMTAVAGDALSGIAKTMAAAEVTADTVEAMRTVAPQLLLSTLAGLAISLPLTLAVWFSPLLVFFDDIKPVPAMLLSLRACISNGLPLLVYCAAVMGPLFVMLKLGMVLTRQPDLGVWLLAPILVPSLYASYLDVFVRDPAAPEQ